jgi:organic radical activating enzyme
MLNIQPAEKRERDYDGSLSVHSIFKTIQGEGPFCGTPCVFVRLAGCNLQCPACDTEYTSGRHRMDVLDIVRAVRAKWYDGADFKLHGLVVITGGEPFRQHIGDLIQLLINHGFYVQIESNGTFNPPVAAWNLNPDQRLGAYLVVSPKTPTINPLTLTAVCALKYVVEHDHIAADGLPTRVLGLSKPPARPPFKYSGPIYIQPQDSKDEAENKRNTAAAVAMSLEHGYILQLQVHKYIGVE